MKTDIVEKLKALHACDEAVEWISYRRSPETAWKNCNRGDWMLWLLGKLGKRVPKEKLATTTAAYADAYAAAADAAIAATAADADYDVRKQVLKQCADIVRKHYPNPPEL